jgi:hypothetical protein
MSLLLGAVSAFFLAIAEWLLRFYLEELLTNMPSEMNS